MTFTLYILTGSDLAEGLVRKLASVKCRYNKRNRPPRAYSVGQSKAMFWYVFSLKKLTIVTFSRVFLFYNLVAVL